MPSQKRVPANVQKKRERDAKIAQQEQENQKQREQKLQESQQYAME